VHGSPGWCEPAAAISPTAASRRYDPDIGQGDEPDFASSICARLSCSASGAAAGSPEPPTEAQAVQPAVVGARDRAGEPHVVRHQRAVGPHAAVVERAVAQHVGARAVRQPVGLDAVGAAMGASSVQPAPGSGAGALSVSCAAATAAGTVARAAPAAATAVFRDSTWSIPPIGVDADASAPAHVCQSLVGEAIRRGSDPFTPRLMRRPPHGRSGTRPGYPLRRPTTIPKRTHVRPSCNVSSNTLTFEPLGRRARTPSRPRAPWEVPMRRLAVLSLAVLPCVLLGAAVGPVSAASAARVKMASTSVGDALVDSRGRTLYQFGKDRRRRSSCSRACAVDWPPLLTRTDPTAGPGVKASKLGTTRRSDGKLQVTYAGRPLYRYVGDSAKGDINGQNLDAFGGVWTLMSPSGARITRDAGQGAPSPSPSPSPSPYPPY
jgi:predicted lipoprotein with Yx(FWY)xxD motif